MSRAKQAIVVEEENETSITATPFLSAFDGTSTLLRLASLAEELGSATAHQEARTLAARVSEGRFYLACVGQFKRGKSTLINALIGDSILPVGFTPMTAVPTVVRYGEQRRARIHGRDGLWREVGLEELSRYVAQDYNPENVEGIGGVEVFVPNPLLGAGMCLVDTPGLGSIFYGNTASTQALIPHIDAALVVLGADPPLAADELALVRTLARQVEDLIFVLTKADRTTDAERAAVMKFTERILRRNLGRNVAPIFQVSAAERLANHAGPKRDWDRLVNALEKLVQQSGRQIVHAACERGINRLSEGLLAIVNEQRESLKRPIRDSEKHIAALKETAACAERSLAELSFSMMAERQRISGSLSSRHRGFLENLLPNLAEQFQDHSLPIFGPSYRRHRMNLAQEIARHHVVPWLQIEQEHAEREYRRATVRFLELGNELLARLAREGMTELALMPHALEAETGFRVKSRFSFAELIELAQPASPLRWLADVALGLAGAHEVIERNARRFLERLLETNVVRVQSDILNRLEESQNRLEADLRRLLHEVVRMAEMAMIQAKRAHDRGASAVEDLAARLEYLEREIRELRAGC